MLTFCNSSIDLNFEKSKFGKIISRVELRKTARNPTPSARPARARGSLSRMRRHKPQPEHRDDVPEPAEQPYGPGWRAWCMANARREIAAGRLRQTIDDSGD